jgi:Mn2+/Fe2+ NRAMP family transporter
MLLVLYLIVLYVMNFINYNKLEGSFDDGRNHLKFHVFCCERYTFLFNLPSFCGINFGLYIMLHIGLYIMLQIDIYIMLHILMLRGNNTQHIIHN